MTATSPAARPADAFAGASAVLFDLDGVLTPTAVVHERAWQELFDGYLGNVPEAQPYRESDYFDHIDGKPRFDGVRDFLASRNIVLPEGPSYDDPAHEDLLVRALALDLTFEPRYQGHSTIKDVAIELGQNWDRLGPVAASAPAPLGAVDFGPFDRAVTAVAGLPELCTDRSDGFYEHLLEILPEMASVSAMSQQSCIAVPPAAATACAVELRDSSLTSAAAIRAPSLAKATLIARPSPPPAPRTSAVLPEISRSIRLLLH